MQTPARIVTSQLAVPPEVRRDLDTFLAEMLAVSPRPPRAIIAFGSAATGDFVAGSSDLNLLVVYDDLELAALAPLAPVCRRWLGKRRFSPRFLSRRNLEQTARYFQLDFLDMRDAHVVLLGDDVLASLTLSPADLHWQLAHETKRMRMRLKQQFWRAEGQADALRDLIVGRAGSLLLLYRGTLLLDGVRPPEGREALAAAAARDLGVDPDFFARIRDWKTGRRRPDCAAATAAATELFAAVRALDAHVEARRPDHA